jgi:hypothetical protein
MTDRARRLATPTSHETPPKPWVKHVDSLGPSLGITAQLIPSHLHCTTGHRSGGVSSR